MTITYGTTYTNPYGIPDTIEGMTELNSALLAGHYQFSAHLNMRVAGALVATTEAGIDLVEGQVSVERFDANRRTLSFSIRGEIGDPVSDHFKSYGSLLGMDIDAQIGINGYLFSMGVFIPDEVEHSQDGINYVISATASDRSTIIATNARTARYVIPSGTPKNAAFESYVRDRYPGVQLVMDALEGTTPSLVFGIQDEPWQGALDLAESFACETYFDRFGRCVLRKILDPRDQGISANYSDNDEAKYPFTTDPVKRSINVREIYNGVIVQAEAPWLLFPVCGHKWNTDVTSDTYYDPSFPLDSPVGPHPLIVRDSKVGTQAAATELAESKFYELIGQSEPVDFTAMIDPRRDVGEVVNVQALEVGIDGRVAVDSLQFPLVPGTMQVSGRKIS